MKKIRLLLLVTIVVISAAGCGGGDNSGSGDNAITGEPVWNAGIGVIAESVMISFSMASPGLSVKEREMKGRITAESFAFPANASSVSRNPEFKASDITDIWKASIKFIYLDWAPLNGATYYQVYYLGNDGSLNQKVWDSREEHKNDPAYTTKAFLDLSDELTGFDGALTAAGTYLFKVIAYNSRFSKELPVITVSIGKILSGFPTELQADAGAKHLSWEGVAEAGGYKVGIYDVSQNRVWDNTKGGPDLLPPTRTSIDFDTLSQGDYTWTVFAYANDAGGKTAEIAYAAPGGFTVK
jgi:hypothetical protein